MSGENNKWEELLLLKQILLPVSDHFKQLLKELIKLGLIV